MKRLWALLFFNSFILFSCSGDPESRASGGDFIFWSTSTCESLHQSEWCSNNQSAGSPFTEVCWGQVIVDDMIYSSLLLRSQNEQKCYIEVDTSDAQATMVSGCAQAFSRKFPGSKDKVEFLSCLDSNGQILSLEGQTTSGENFRAEK